MKITPIPGEALRYRVSSQSGGEDHLVDLSENLGNGECDCIRFRITCTRHLNNQEPLYTIRTACAHIRACWDHWRIRSLFIASAQTQRASCYLISPLDITNADNFLSSPGQAQSEPAREHDVGAHAPEPLGKSQGRK